MNWMLIAFWIFAVIAVLSGLGILLLRRVMHAALSLMLCMMSVAAVFVFTGSDFLAVTQLLIYVGGILILMIFGIMFTNTKRGEQAVNTGTLKWLAIPTALLTGGLLTRIAVLNTDIPENEAQRSTIDELGLLLMTKYVIVFETIAVFLLIALVGVVFIAGREAGSSRF